MVYCGYSKDSTAVLNTSETSLGWVPQKTPKNWVDLKFCKVNSETETGRRKASPLSSPQSPPPLRF